VMVMQIDYYYYSNALMSLMSSKEMRFQVPPNTFRLDGWITQRVRQRVLHQMCCDETAEYSVCDGWRHLRYIDVGGRTNNSRGIPIELKTQSQSRRVNIVSDMS